MTQRAWVGVILAGLCACSPTDMADKVGRRAAETVVLPVVSEYLPGPQAQAATTCIVSNASASEVQALARDVAVVAGTSTVDLIFRMVQNPATMACLRNVGLPSLSRVSL